MLHRPHKTKVPLMFRPLLWSLRWETVDIDTDKADIIVNTINEGTLAHWHWIQNIYGNDTIRRILKKRLASEFHPESLRLAQVIFNVPLLRYAR